VCARFRASRAGGMLLSKLGRPSAGGVLPAGFGLELGEARGLGVNLADLSGVSVHLELGRTPLADGEWHHACVVLQRRAPAGITLFTDGRHDERVPLDGSRLQRLGRLDSDAPLYVGRRSGGEAGAALDGAVREVALWARELLPEHVELLHATPQWSSTVLPPAARPLEHGPPGRPHAALRQATAGSARTPPAPARRQLLPPRARGSAGTIAAMLLLLLLLARRCGLHTLHPWGRCRRRRADQGSGLAADADECTTLLTLER